MLISREQFMALTARINERYLPWLNVVQGDLTLSRLARLSLFQVSVGICFVLLNGTLNRIMVVELGRAAWLVSAMLALPLLLAPARVLIGYRSDTHQSFLGYRRLPYLWMGTMGQFGGLALMPFVLILMTSADASASWMGFAMSLGALLLVGAGMHTTQTAGLALATDLASEKTRHQVVTMLYLMLLVGMVIGALGFSLLLEPFSYFRLIQVIQGSALVVAGLNIVAMWQMEPRRPDLTSFELSRPSFGQSWRALSENPGAHRLLIAVALGTLGFSMQEILLEPYGAEVLAMSVSQTTRLTAIFAGGMLIAMALSARYLGRAGEPIRLAAYGAVVGVFAFAAVIMAGAFDSLTLVCCWHVTNRYWQWLICCRYVNGCHVIGRYRYCGSRDRDLGCRSGDSPRLRRFPRWCATGHDGSPDTGRHDQPAIVRPRDTLWRGLSPRNNYLIRLARCTGTIGAAARQ